MSVADVLAVAERGRAAGCAECLFTLGDRPEARYIEAANELKALGFASTVEYVAHCCAMVLEHTGLLPHVNAGVLTFDELKLIRTVSVSQGLMLESASERLVTEKGAAHWKCDTKKPDVRLRVMEHAGELNIPFTSGIMVGIGETRAERVDGMALRVSQIIDSLCSHTRPAKGRLYL
jgi:7,8-didemethyl-8-hydroxy-5-deazariboflavin synthase CofG subunit|tara:strand:- start:9167 stop:9697 length:531 start_codon:yes stop_codon:yes gene_type:complete